MNSVKVERWEGCYDQQWAGVLTPESSMAHPAKYSRGLIERIYRHCLERRYLKRGNLVGDCFGGVGTGGIMAAYAGLRWVGVELEPRFVEMANANFEMHRDHLNRLGFHQPKIIQGDSRQFDKLVGQAAGIVSSPPFVDSLAQVSKNGVKPPHDTRKTLEGNYGTTPGQIGSLKAGEVGAVVSSPPYSDIAAGQGGLNTKPAKKPGQQTGRTATLASQNADQHYGDTEGQIGQDKGEDYWSACKLVYAACFRAIKPGGVMVLVTKAYVKNRKIVPLSDDTVTLCQSLGFTLIERIQAMLVSETRHGDLFTGEDVKTKSRKSFFRRLAESKGSPAINHEDVLVFSRP